MPTSTTRLGGILKKLAALPALRNMTTNNISRHIAISEPSRGIDEGNVFDRHYDHQRPEDQEQDAEDVIRRDRNRMGAPANTSLIAYSGLVPMSP